MSFPIPLHQVGDLLRHSGWVEVEDELQERFRMVLRARPDLISEVHSGRRWQVWSGKEALDLSAYSRTEEERYVMPGIHGPIQCVMVTGWTERTRFGGYGGAGGSCMSQAAVAGVIRGVIAQAGAASQRGQMALI